MCILTITSSCSILYIHYTAKSVWIIDVNPWTLICCYDSLHSSERCWLLGFAPIQPQEREWGQTMMLGDKAWLGFCVPVHLRRCRMGDEVRSPGRPVKSSHIQLENNVFMELDLCTGVLSCWNKNNKLSVNCCHKVWSPVLSKEIICFSITTPLHWNTCRHHKKQTKHTQVCGQRCPETL